jgi:hypothetical protein
MPFRYKAVRLGSPATHFRQYHGAAAVPRLKPPLTDHPLQSHPEQWGRDVQGVSALDRAPARVM